MLRKYEKEVEKCSIFIKSNGSKLKILCYQRDSLIKQKLEVAGSFKLNLLLTELSGLQIKDETHVKNL